MNNKQRTLTSPQPRGVRGGGGMCGFCAPPPPRPAKYSMFLGKIVFFLVFRQKVGSCPSPWSADAYVSNKSFTS